MEDSSWWGDAWDTVTESVNDWFTTDTGSSVVTDTGTAWDNYSASDFDLTSDDYGTGTAWDNYDVKDFDAIMDVNFAREDDWWDSAWDATFDTVKTAGSAIGDFANTKAGQMAISQGIGMLGQYLMDDSRTGMSAPRMPSGGGPSMPAEDPNVSQGRTKSNLASRMVR